MSYRVQCLKCKKHFRITDVESHMYSHFSAENGKNRPLRAKCLICQISFIDLTAYYAHMNHDPKRHPRDTNAESLELIDETERGVTLSYRTFVETFTVPVTTDGFRMVDERSAGRLAGPGSPFNPFDTDSGRTPNQSFGTPAYNGTPNYAATPNMYDGGGGNTPNMYDGGGSNACLPNRTPDNYEELRTRSPIPSTSATPNRPYESGRASRIGTPGYEPAGSEQHHNRPQTPKQAGSHIPNQNQGRPQTPNQFQSSVPTQPPYQQYYQFFYQNGMPSQQPVQVQSAPQTAANQFQNCIPSQTQNQHQGGAQPTTNQFEHWIPSEPPSQPQSGAQTPNHRGPRTPPSQSENRNRPQTPRQNKHRSQTPNRQGPRTPPNQTKRRPQTPNQENRHTPYQSKKPRRQSEHVNRNSNSRYASTPREHEEHFKIRGEGVSYMNHDDRHNSGSKSPGFYEPQEVFDEIRTVREQVRVESRSTAKVCPSQNRQSFLATANTQPISRKELEEQRKRRQQEVYEREKEAAEEKKREQERQRQQEEQRRKRPPPPLPKRVNIFNESTNQPTTETSHPSSFQNPYQPPQPVPPPQRNLYQPQPSSASEIPLPSKPQQFSENVTPQGNGRNHHVDVKPDVSELRKQMEKEAKEKAKPINFQRAMLMQSLNSTPNSPTQETEQETSKKRRREDDRDDDASRPSTSSRHSSSQSSSSSRNDYRSRNQNSYERSSQRGRNEPERNERYQPNQRDSRKTQQPSRKRERSYDASDSD